MKAAITWNIPGSADTRLPIADEAFRSKITEIFRARLEKDGILASSVATAEVSVTFMSPEEIAKINGQYRKIPDPTDILSFPLWEKDGEFKPEDWQSLPLGDLIVCPERVAANAEEHKKTYEEELVLVLSHGFLHLTGRDHCTEEEQNRMWAEQDEMTAEYFRAAGVTDKTKLTAEAAESLVAASRGAAVNSYAPYSHFPVGAAILFKNGEIVTGCNVENASYGLTICAERNAMSAAVARGLRDPLAIAVTGNTPHCAPCGACRQFLSEFNPDMLVVTEGGDGVSIRALNELLPMNFSLRPQREVDK